MVTPVGGDSGIRAHNSTGDTTGTFRGAFFDYFSRGITTLIDVSCYPDHLLGADRNAEIATLTPFGIDDNII
jgi:hypothetical protein